MPEPIKRKRRIVSVLLIILTVAAVFLTMAVSFVAHEVRRANDRAGKVNPERLIQTILATRHDSQLTNPTTSTATAKYVLQFPALVPDSPDLPQKLRDSRDSFNQKYDSLLLLIAEYQKNKNTMTQAQFDALRVRIQDGRKSLIADILLCLGKTSQNDIEWCRLPQTGSIGQIRDAVVRLVYADFDMLTEQSAKTDHPWSACQFADSRLIYEKFEWHSGRQGGPVQIAEFYTERGRDGYYRQLHYYWQYRRDFGYDKVLKTVWSQFYEEHLDRKIYRIGLPQ